MAEIWRDYVVPAGFGERLWLLVIPIALYLAFTAVLFVVLGHVVGVIAAHERAVRILPRRHQLTGQLPLLFAMVAFTVGGLYLLFAS